MVDFQRAKRRSRFEAALLERTAVLTHAQHGKRKQAEIGAMQGTIVELGPGTGVNMRYYAPGVKVIAIEPNPVMHDKLQASADEHGVDLEIRTLRGEHIDVEDSSADGVVSTLVLCGVENTAQVLSEVRRVLRPGAPYFFLEHVRSPTPVGHAVQRMIKIPHRWMFNGCEVDRDLKADLEAAGFSSLDVSEIDSGPRAAYVRHQIIGTASWK